MNREYGTKGATLLVLAFGLGVANRGPEMEALVSPFMSAGRDSGDLHSAVGGIALLLAGFAFYNLAMAKGRSAVMSLWALLPLLGLVVWLLLRDRLKDAPLAGADEVGPLKICPHCGVAYRESEYSPDAKEIFCGKCRGVLPR